jgi:hypothetical protein
VTKSHYVTQASLELTILLPQPPECWDHSALPHLAPSVLDGNSSEKSPLTSPFKPAPHHLYHPAHTIYPYHFLTGNCISTLTGRRPIRTHAPWGNIDWILLYSQCLKHSLFLVVKGIYFRILTLPCYEMHTSDLIGNDLLECSSPPLSFFSFFLLSIAYFLH